MADELKPETVETPPPAPVIAPDATPASPPAAQSKIVERLSKLGFENVTDEDAFDRLASAYEQQREQFGSQLKEALAEIRSQAPPATSDAGTPQSWWNPPQVDLTVAARYRTPDGGWKPETPTDIRQGVEALESYRDNFAKRLVADPEATLAPLLEKSFQQFFTKQYGQLTAQQQERQFLTQAIQDNPWIYEKDPHTGQRTERLTAEGQRFNEIVIDLENGDYDPQTRRYKGGLSKTKAFDVAMRLRAGEKAASASTRVTAEEAAAINAGKKAGLVGSPPTTRAGSLPAPGKTTTPNRNLSFGAKVMQNLEAGK